MSFNLLWFSNPRYGFRDIFATQKRMVVFAWGFLWFAMGEALMHVSLTSMEQIVTIAFVGMNVCLYLFGVTQLGDPKNSREEFFWLGTVGLLIGGVAVFVL